ncbi:hypothetical protein VY88_27545 [Azospirillum thiophilum]|uniref:Cation efflux protein transmembrane domain-containing protein n=1 Tax=Azospirillum thiophilum TaxID=528244 RepID=A0AAC8W555_9PROT|nr:cation transporter [Azospirillum thiophilum]ALG75241.1 hypothetical protein AL072_30440 [Azospirillum thiophilum]KJR62634.1 hypothetical protein VY88_27545 [Azospirillum thiophilum]
MGVVAIAANLAITVTRFGAAPFTGSASMLSEAVHSLVDTGNEASMLAGLKRSKRLQDERHPFGYARELNFWTFRVALVIAATFLAYETKSLLIDESALPDLVRGVRALLLDEPAVDRVNEVLTIHLGPVAVIVTISPDVRDDATAGASEPAQDARCIGQAAR